MALDCSCFITHKLIVFLPFFLLALDSLQNFRGDTLGPHGITFRDNLYEFLFEQVQMFLVRRASVQDMSYTGTSVSGLHNPKTAAAPQPPLNGDNVDDLYQSHHPPRSSSMDASFTNGAGPSTFPCRILTSTMPRATDTVTWEESDNDFNIDRMSNLNPLDKGDFAGMELDEIKELNPEWYAKLARDPFLTRYVRRSVLTLLLLVQSIP
jgi:hypothetical protein